jgi:Flp pilus assembly protein TadG
MKFRSNHRRRGRGQALVEFALVIPIFLILLMAVFDLGRAVFAYNSITNAVREGARLAIVNQNTALITQRALDQTSLAGTGSPTVTISFRKNTPNDDFMTNPDCQAYTSNTRPMALNCVAVVTYQTTYRPITPLISNILFGSGVNLAATTTLNVEYVCPNPNVTVATNCAKQP